MKAFLTHPLVILAACAAGLCTGFLAPGLTDTIKPIGDTFLSLLNMCVLPIIICAIVSSIGSLFDKTSECCDIKKMLYLFSGFIAMACVTGLICSIGFFSVFDIGKDIQKTVGALMVSNDANTGGTDDLGFQSVIYDISTISVPVTDSDSGISVFVDQLVAENIFAALSSKSLLQILTFFLLFSVMLKYVKEQDRRLIVSFSDAILNVMQKLIDIIICFLPIGLWALLANQFKHLNVEFLMSLGSFVLIVWISSFATLAVAVFFFWTATGLGPFKQASLLKAPIFIALSTRSSFPTLPTALTALEEFGLEKGSTNLSVSLGHSLCKYGKSMIFCIGSIYSFHLYNIPISFFNLICVLVLSILAGMAASGAPSIISRTMIALVLAPLGVPSEAIIIILLTVDPITDPIITLVSTYPNYAVAAMLSPESGACVDLVPIEVE